MNKEKVLLYHAGCPDGFGSRWCFERKYGDTMKYIAVAHGSPPPDNLEGKDVYIADFSYPRDILLALKEKCHSLTVIDHHKTAQDNLHDLDFCHFDMAHSGAILSWYFCNGLNKEPPLLLKYIEDRDIWKWQMPFGKEVLEVIDSYDYSQRLWDELEARLDDDENFQIILAEGSALLRYKDRKVSELYRKRHMLEILGRSVVAVNSGIYQTELAYMAANEPDQDFGLAYYFDGEDYVFSIRPGFKNTFDVSEIAVQFGGGGHKTASGFRIRSLADLNGITARIENTDEEAD